MNNNKDKIYRVISIIILIILSIKYIPFNQQKFTKNYEGYVYSSKAGKGKKVHITLDFKTFEIFNIRKLNFEFKYKGYIYIGNKKLKLGVIVNKIGGYYSTVAIYKEGKNRVSYLAKISEDFKVLWLDGELGKELNTIICAPARNKEEVEKLRKDFDKYLDYKIKLEKENLKSNYIKG